MKITLTGSLGNIGKPLSQLLVQNGHEVTVIISKPERLKSIEAIGAKAAIGTMEDVDFLCATFQGADIVYCMETLEAAGGFFNPNLDFLAAISSIARNYKKAIEYSKVTQVIHLSSIGAHTNKGNGILAFHYAAENILRQLADNVSVKFMRPVGFYNNMFTFIPTIKTQNVIIQNYSGDKKEPWVSPIDIATTIAEEMEKPFNGKTVRYIASDEVSPNEVAKILGQAIGKPDLKWVEVTDEQLLQGILASGMNPQVAKGFVEMKASQRTRELYEDYDRNKPQMGKVKMTDFAKEFSMVYNQK